MADATIKPLGPLALDTHFTSPTYGDWQAGVRRTLRGQTAEDVVQWTTAAGLALPSMVFDADGADVPPRTEAASAFSLSHMLIGPPEGYLKEAEQALALGADHVAVWATNHVATETLHEALGSRLRVYATHQPERRAEAAWLPLVWPDTAALPPTSQVLLDGAVFTEAGADTITALAWHLALANRYLRQRRALAPDLEAGVLRVALTLEPMLDVARLTATRRVFRQFFDAWGLDTKVSLHAVTSYRYQTRQDVHNNLIRASLQGVAAALAGVDELTVRPYGSGDPEAMRWALGLGHLLRSESRFGTRPPVEDAWWVSAAAEEIASQAWTRFQAIEAAGGFNAVWPSPSGLARIRSQHQRRVEAAAMGEHALVGTTRFLDDSSAIPPALLVPNDLPSVLRAGSFVHPLERVSTAFEYLRDRGLKARQQRSMPPVLMVDLAPRRTAPARQLATDFFRMAGLDTQLVAAVPEDMPDSRLRVACVLSDANGEFVGETLSMLEARQPGLLRYVVQHPTTLADWLRPHVDDCLHPGMNRLELIHDLHLSLGLV